MGEQSNIEQRIEQILDLVTEKHIPNLPALPDFVTRRKFRPFEYRTELHLDNLDAEAKTVDVVAFIYKDRSKTEYANFEEYSDKIKKNILDPNKTNGQKNLLTIGLITNFLEFYEPYEDHEHVKRTSNSLQQIRFLLQKTWQKKEDVLNIDPKKSKIRVDELEKASEVYLMGFEENFYLHPEITTALIKHELAGKFKKNQPFAVKMKTKVWYEPK